MELIKELYHANLFPLIRHEPLPVYRYLTSVDPRPTTRPQKYQILGALAKKIMYKEKIPVVSDGEELRSLSSQISTLTGYNHKIPGAGEFDINLEKNGHSDVDIESFDEYRVLVNRLADIALTIFSKEYYKFHPAAPYVLRDEPYFDAELIAKTGIIDSKKYYRGLHRFNDLPVFALNRETQLRSNKNLLHEIFGLKKRFDLGARARGSKSEIDVYDPPKEFIEYVNSHLRGKAAEVKGYPGPRVWKIEEITWEYRAKDITPGSKESPIDYLYRTYGITQLDENQPLVKYEVGYQRNVQYHVPEVLSVGHTFRDLERRVPSWQRPQVWSIIHPNCKNQLQKIYSVMHLIDIALRGNIPEVYPKFVEISLKPVNIESYVLSPAELTLKFGNKSITINSPYNVGFYRKYSKRKINFANPVGPIKALIYTKIKTQKITPFLDELAVEFKLRNNTEMSYDLCSNEDFENLDFSGYDVFITISDSSKEEEIYTTCKKKIQNTSTIVHQHITEENANSSSIMALIMELTLKLGGDPWLLPDHEKIRTVVGIYSYFNPFSGKGAVIAIAMDSNGEMLKQFDPIEPESFMELVTELVELNKKRANVFYMFSFDRFGLIEPFIESLRDVSNIEYCITEINNQDYFRFFKTWIPRKAPRFGKTSPEIVTSPYEAYEEAPQGVAVKSDSDTFFLLTGRTIQKDAIKRGCPTPIKLVIKDKRGNIWNSNILVKIMFELCMMGRASGHMTRFPVPLYYLHSYANYYSNFGVPTNAETKQRIFYI